MTRTTPLLILAVLVGGSATGWATETPPFRFQIPEGWTDLSPGAPEQDLAEIPSEVLREARVQEDAGGEDPGSGEDPGHDRWRPRGLPVYNLTSPSLNMRQIQYLVPGGDLRYAILTYSATPETFDEYRAVFEASAVGTRGAGVPTSRLWKSLRGGLIRPR